MLSPFFAWVFRSAKMRSCLRIRFAPSISIELAISSSSDTCLVLSSERCMRERRGWPRWAGWANRESWSAPQREGDARNMRRRLGAKRSRRDLARRPVQWGSVASLPRTVKKSGSEVAVEECRQLRFGERAHLLRVHLAALVQDDRRNAADAELARRGGVGVDVELRDLELAPVGARDFVEHGRKHLAGPAPFGPEVDQHRRLRLQHVLLERGIGNVPDHVTHRKNPFASRLSTPANARPTLCGSVPHPKRTSGSWVRSAKIQGSRTFERFEKHTSHDLRRHRKLHSLQVHRLRRRVPGRLLP